MPTAENKSWWWRSIVTDCRSLGFCVIEGFALALPVGLFLIPEKVRAAVPVPDNLRAGMVWICLGAMLLLPFWALAMLQYQRSLFWLGILTFLALLVLLPSSTI